MSAKESAYEMWTLARAALSPESGKERTVNLRITLDVTVTQNADFGGVAERVAHLIATDPDDLIPEIETVDDFDARLAPQ